MTCNDFWKHLSILLILFGGCKYYSKIGFLILVYLTAEIAIDECGFSWGLRLNYLLSMLLCNAFHAGL
jgi:hypothetical protein